jgi:hypothetical protein
MENFKPVPAAIGGVLIGLSAALLWVTKGRAALPPRAPVISLGAPPS